MREVGAFNAKSTLGTLLDQVEAGDEIVITRRGKAVARLVSAKTPVATGTRAAEAADRIRTRVKSAASTPMRWDDWQPLRDEGRQ